MMDSQGSSVFARCFLITCENNGIPRLAVGVESYLKRSKLRLVGSSWELICTNKYILQKMLHILTRIIELGVSKGKAVCVSLFFNYLF